MKLLNKARPRRVFATLEYVNTAVGIMRDPKQLAEYWKAIWALSNIPPPDWKRAYIWIVFKIIPPRID